MIFWAMKSEGVGLIVRTISFQYFQPTWPITQNIKVYEIYTIYAGSEYRALADKQFGAF